MRLIGVSGLAGSGKDAVASILVSERQFCRVALADPLKRACADWFGWSHEQLWGPSHLRNTPDTSYPRPLRFQYPEKPLDAVWFPIGGGGRTLIDECDLALVSSKSWCLKRRTDTHRTEYVRETTSSLKLHQLILRNEDPSLVIDHVNCDGLDNRRSNLRICSQSQNHANEQKRRRGSSLFKGVSYDSSRKKWSAKIAINYKTINLGRFDDEAAAALAYDRAALEYYGEFARKNSDIYLTPRHALQTLGTEWARSLHADIWVRQALKARDWLQGRGHNYTPQDGCCYSDSPTSFAGVVIPDTRYPNELAAIRAAGGVVWRVVRPGAGLSGEAGAHASETSVRDEDCDLVIVNDGSLDDLKRKVLEVCR